MLCFAGIDTVDYSLYPTKDVQLRWLRGYLEEKRKLQGSADDVSNAELEELYRQTNKCALVGRCSRVLTFLSYIVCICSLQLSHLMWGLWALVQARYSSIDFDYLE